MDMNLYMQFHESVNRVNTECIKWDNRASFGNKDALPMWVADMDFRTAEGVVDALVKRAQHGVFGYAQESERDVLAVVNWMKNRHATEVKPEWVLYSPGVVDSIYHVLNAKFEKGARVVIQPPVYGPFSGMTKKAGMELVENCLIEKENGWEMDYEGLEDIFKNGADAFILCSPHNPIGRIWKREELQKLVDLCNQYGVLLIADEIHADFELRGAKHTSILSIPGGENAVVFISATKTFNLAAIRHSTILCPNEELRNKIRDSLNNAMAEVNLFGRLATRAAYETGWDWLDALNEYLSDSRDILMEGIEKIDGIRAIAPQGTYLLWLDAKGLNMNDEELNEFFIHKCGIIPTVGTFFGTGGSGHMRLNFATTHKNILTALERIEKAVKAL